MEVIKGSIYDWPAYYEFIYGSDWKAECDFLERIIALHVGDLHGHWLEPACGTGRLIFRLAKRGRTVSGIDLNERAVDYCNRRLKKHGLPQSARVADMSDFRVEQPCSAAFNTINSFRHLEQETDAVAHLQCVAAALQPGGVYILGLHLTPTECEPDEEESWVHRRGHLQINASMWLVERDLTNRFETFALAFDVYTPSRQFRIQDEFRFRTYTSPQFLQLIEQVSELRLVEQYDFGYADPIELDGRTQDCVFILQRT